MGGQQGPVVAERRLVDAATRGDLVAFESLVRRYQLPVVRLCTNLLGDEHAAQDAAQDTFFSAWRALGRFRGDAAFSTWLYRIATNRCLKELRRRKPTGGPVPELPTTEGGPNEQFEASEQVSAVVRAVRDLPNDQRAALLLRDVEGLPYIQIAQILGVSMPAVKSRIYRARTEVARLLAPPMNEAPDDRSSR